MDTKNLFGTTYLAETENIFLKVQKKKKKKKKVKS